MHQTNDILSFTFLGLWDNIGYYRNERFIIGAIILRKTLLALYCVAMLSALHSQTSLPAYGQLEIEQDCIIIAGYVNTDFAIIGVYVIKSDEVDWGRNYLQTRLIGSAKHPASTSITFEQGLYHVCIITEGESYGVGEGKNEHVAYNILIRENYITKIIFNSSGLQVCPHKKMEGF